MHNEITSESRLGFSDYQVDLSAGEVRKHGRKVRLAGRPFQILALLLEKPGKVLTRKELQAQLWPADTFVDFEHGMNAAIQTLRRALCDSHKRPRFIETLPRRGYRFIAAVERIPSSTERAAEPGPPSPARDTHSASTAARSDWVGQIATICDGTGRNYVLLPVTMEVLGELRDGEASKDDLGISLLVASEKLLLVNCGTRVKILEASNPALGCKVRILGGQFVGEKAFVSRVNLSGLE